MAIKFDKIKLIIWDLDDTFWTGTLSEGDIVPVESNIELVTKLTDCGVVNSICSKNDEDPVNKKLTELGIADLFVFNSVNWQPKGQRIAARIKEMGLRPVNCLFIDDNVQNLREAEYNAEGLMTALPSEIPSLIDYFANKETTDLKHKRLQQYKVLEQKAEAASHFSDNTEFLFSSNIRVEINYDCSTEVERLAEMVIRTNQLNFTKRRDSLDEIKALIEDMDCTTGYVSVKDNFGDYGIVGFFAVKNHQCIHFLFSCRTIGQGIEQYVYAKLGYPELNTVGPVIGEVNHEPAPRWINQQCATRTKTTAHNSVKILFKGACDLGQMCSYMNSDSIETEFTYIGKARHNHIEFHNHSVNYLTFPFLSPEQRDELVESLTFADAEMFDTRLYDNDLSMVVMSTMMEANLGVYRRKVDGLRIAALESLYPLTDSANWDSYVNHKIFDAQNNFTRQWLERFANEWEFCGALTPDEMVNNARQLLNRLPANTKLCYILGPELEYKAETKPQYIGRHLQYTEINRRFRRLAAENFRIFLLDTNNFVKSQSDFTNNINHWQRKIYYQMAGELNRIVADNFNILSKRKSRFYLFLTDIKYRMVRAGFLDTRFWKIARRLFR